MTAKQDSLSSAVCKTASLSQSWQLRLPLMLNPTEFRSPTGEPSPYPFAKIIVAPIMALVSLTRMENDRLAKLLTATFAPVAFFAKPFHRSDRHVASFLTNGAPFFGLIRLRLYVATS